MIMLKKISLMLLGLSLVSALSGCNTIAGIGKDVQKVGQKVEGVGKK
jgi:predicted small secreted protein